MSNEKEQEKKLKCTKCQSDNTQLVKFLAGEDYINTCHDCKNQDHYVSRNKGG